MAIENGRNPYSFYIEPRPTPAEASDRQGRKVVEQFFFAHQQNLQRTAVQLRQANADRDRTLAHGPMIRRVAARVGGAIKGGNEDMIESHQRTADFFAGVIADLRSGNKQPAISYLVADFETVMDKAMNTEEKDRADAMIAEAKHRIELLNYLDTDKADEMQQEFDEKTIFSITLRIACMYPCKLERKGRQLDNGIVKDFVNLEQVRIEKNSLTSCQKIRFAVQKNT